MIAAILPLLDMETEMSTRDLNAEFEAATAENASWGALPNLLDSISSLDEFAELKRLGGDEDFEGVIEYYEENLRKWSDPKLPEGFEKHYPLVAERLDTPEKVRVFLRGADFRDVDPMTMGGVFEDILRRHHQNGEKKVVYSTYRGDKRCDALRIVYHTELEAWTLTELLLPEAKTKGVSSDEGLFIDWRTKEERKTAGERY